MARIEEKLNARKQINLRDETILEELNIPVNSPKQRTTQLVCWERPKPRRVKVNIDGASRGNPGIAGAGSVLEDSSGNLIMAFFTHIGTGINNYAELMGLLHELRLAKKLAIQQLDGELDSLLVVKWLKE